MSKIFQLILNGIDERSIDSEIQTCISNNQIVLNYYNSPNWLFTSQLLLDAYQKDNKFLSIIKILENKQLFTQYQCADSTFQPQCLYQQNTEQFLKNMFQFRNQKFQSKLATKLSNLYSFPPAAVQYEIIPILFKHLQLELTSEAYFELLLGCTLNPYALRLNLLNYDNIDNFISQNRIELLIGIKKFYEVLFESELILSNEDQILYNIIE